MIQDANNVEQMMIVTKEVTNVTPLSAGQLTIMGVVGSGACGTSDPGSATDNEESRQLRDLGFIGIGCASKTPAFYVNRRGLYRS